MKSDSSVRRASQKRQHDYYTETATAYESMHVRPGDEHFVALEYVSALLGVVRAQSVLDIGSGTGRALQFLRHRRPELQVEGVEPVSELREHAEAAGITLHDASGESLPFADSSFDVVTSFGVLHHVRRPAQVIAEMTRVARCGIMISDSNRFGQGSTASRLLKLALRHTGMWPALDYVRTRGRGYMESPGDGIYYSYSIFDSVPQLQTWANRVFVVPTAPRTSLPLLQIATPHGLLVALREHAGHGWAGL